MKRLLFRLLVRLLLKIVWFRSIAKSHSTHQPKKLDFEEQCLAKCNRGTLANSMYPNPCQNWRNKIHTTLHTKLKNSVVGETQILQVTPSKSRQWRGDWDPSHCHSCSANSCPVNLSLFQNPMQSTHPSLNQCMSRTPLQILDTLHKTKSRPTTTS